MSEYKNKLESENAELKAQLNILSSAPHLLANSMQVSENEIDFNELWYAIWSGKWLITIVTSFFAVSSILYALLLPNEYESTVLLSPASSSSSSSLSKLAGKFGGLASLAGINIGGGGKDNSLIAMELVKSWGFLEAFIKDNDIAVEVFAAKGWHLGADKLIIDDKIYDISQKKWVRKFDKSKGQKAKPSSWELYEKFKERISVNQDKNSGLISISVEYYSPYIAKHWLDALIVAINHHMKVQDRNEALSSIKYLEKQVKKTNISEMQTIFYELIQEQTKNLMLAEVSDEYVFKTIISARVEEEKSGPKRALIVILATILGGIFGSIVVLIRYFIQREK